MSITPQVPASGATVVMAHVFPSFDFGGQQARFATLAGALGDRFEHKVASLDGDFSARALVPQHANVSYRKMEQDKSVISGMVNYSHFRKYFSDLNPDILCTYNWGSMEAVLSNRLGRRLPHIHFEDGFGVEEADGNQLWRRVTARRWLLSASHVVVPSFGLEEIAIAKWQIKPSRLHHIQNGIEYSRFQRPPSALRSTVMVGSIGALRSEKNYQRLIRAFIDADRDGNTNLKIIGEGPERERLVREIKVASGSPRISLPGATKAPEDALRDFDIFALSSDTEQAPLTVMEAMAAALPVVATNVGDIANMVSAENRAFITPCGDEGAYAEALSHLIQNPDARAALGTANRKKAKAEFDLAPMVEKYRDLFNTVLCETMHQA
ncbi:MAG: glycosyltransferase [Marinicaulis sp.]|nr:glycosyltransferase [Marinicaulis sp.]